MQSLNTLSSVELDKQELQEIQVSLQALMAVQLGSSLREMRKLQILNLYLVKCYFYFVKQEKDINLEAREALLQCISAYKEVNVFV